MSNFVIIGLGNPGMEYKNTRHNAGFDVLDEFCRNLNIEFKKSILSNFYFAEARIENIHFTLIKPDTFMNNSGLVIPKVKKKFFKDDTTCFVVCDNYDLNFGGIKIKKNPKNSTHNGIKSILSFANFPIYFLFIGIGRPSAGESIINFVLSKPNQEDKVKLEKTIKQAAEMLIQLSKKSPESLMNEFNKK